VTVSSAATRHAEPDQVCAAAVDLAREAAEEDAGPEQVGAYVGVEAEADRVVTHLFASLDPAYVGWRWAVTVSRASRSKVVTVSESLLLPGPDSLLAPPWVPWTERVRPGDLKAGDLMPASSDDERLVPFVAIAGEVGLLDWDDADAWRFAPEAPVVPVAAGAADAEGAQGQTADAEGAQGQTAEVESAQGQAVGAEGAQGQAVGVESAQGQAVGAEGAQGQAVGAEGAQGQATGAEGAQDQAAETEDAQGQDGAGEAVGPADRPRGEVGRRPGAGSARRERGEAVLRPRRVLSVIGRDEAAARWYMGEHGPESALASSAPATCMTCGFMVRLSGTLGRVFGVCANEFAPDDGKVVSADHGCGAHSDGDVAADDGAVVLPAIDELGYDMLNTGATVPDSVLEKLDHELA
jgi:Protein of unknown function (DUF3027)